MQALVIRTARENHIDLVVDNVEIPTVQDDDVLIKVAIAGISPGSVTLAKLGQSRVPSVLGHLVAGTVVAIGNKVTSVTIGDRVRLHPVLSCGKCRHCCEKRDQFCDQSGIMGFARFCRQSNMYDKYHHGGAAEYVKGPYWLVDRLPEVVSFESASKIHDTATASSVLKQANLKKDSVVLLTAPTGTMGVLTLRIAHLYPIKKLILVGRSRERLQQVRQLTQIPTEIFALDASNDSDQADNGQSLGARIAALAAEDIDVIIDYLPSGDMISNILPALRTGGTLVHMGGNVSPLCLPLITLMQRGWTVLGTRSHTREDAKECLSWMTEGKLKIDDLISHRFPLSEMDKAVKTLNLRDEPMWLTVIDVGRVAA